MAYEVEVVLTNEDEGYQFSSFSEPLVEWRHAKADGTPDFGAIYRSAQSEYGRCQSSVYVDTAAGVKRVGWFFVSRQRYDDSTGSYLRGAWVTVIEVEPAVARWVEVA